MLRKKCETDKEQRNMSMALFSPTTSLLPWQRPKIITFGDSITQFGSSILNQGWTAGLQDYYCRSADLVNHGYAGYTSRTHKFLSQQLFHENLPERESVVLITLFLGANDSVDPAHTTTFKIGPYPVPNQHVPLEEYKYNINFIVDHLRLIFFNAKGTLFFSFWFNFFLKLIRMRSYFSNSSAN